MDTNKEFFNSKNEINITELFHVKSYLNYYSVIITASRSLGLAPKSLSLPTKMVQP